MYSTQSCPTTLGWVMGGVGGVKGGRGQGWVGTKVGGQGGWSGRVKGEWVEWAGPRVGGWALQYSVHVC